MSLANNLGFRQKELTTLQKLVGEHQKNSWINGMNILADKPDNRVRQYILREIHWL